MESLLLHEKVKIANTDCCKLGASLFDCASLIAFIVSAISRDYVQQSHTRNVILQMLHMACMAGLLSNIPEFCSDSSSESEPGRNADRQKLWRASGVSKLALILVALDFRSELFQSEIPEVACIESWLSFVQALSTSYSIMKTLRLPHCNDPSVPAA